MMTKKIYEETRDKTRLGYVPIITTFISRQLLKQNISIFENAEMKCTVQNERNANLSAPLFMQIAKRLEMH